MKAIKVISAIIILIILGLVIAMFTLPSEAHMERSVVIRATPGKVYRELVSFRNFNVWYPWAMKDATTRYTYEGPELGVGTRIVWASDNADVGSGYMEIVDVEENRKVTSIMNFDGYEGTPTTSFILEPVSEGTRVTWTYDETDVSGISKIYVLGIDGFLGEDYEKGLEMIRRRVESAPDFEYPVSLEHMKSFAYVGVKDSSLNDPSMVSTKMAKNYGQLISLLGNKGIEMTGYRVAFFDSLSDHELSFTCALPVNEPLPMEEIGLIKGASPEGLVIKVKFTGGYHDLEKAYAEIEKFAAFYNYKLAGNPWEEYVTDTENEPDTSQWVTNIYYPVE